MLQGNNVSSANLAKSTRFPVISELNVILLGFFFLGYFTLFTLDAHECTNIASGRMCCNALWDF